MQNNWKYEKTDPYYIAKKLWKRIRIHNCPECKTKKEGK